MMGKRTIRVIGLTGGIGAGKSEVASMFAELGCAVSDSDGQAKAALERPEVAQTLVSWWGREMLDALGRVDRRRVASIVFSDPEARARLEALVHPIIRREREAALLRAAAEERRAFVIDAPLLLEAGLDRECDAIVFVDTPRPERLARLAASRSWDEAEVRRREAAQLPVEEKRRRSGYTIMNHGSRADVLGQVRDVLEQITRAGS
ncbi:MAG: dephospho-CoA kinase [Phycisphaerales bacterium]